MPISAEQSGEATLEHGSMEDLETLDPLFFAKLTRELKLIQDISWNIGSDASPGVFERACDEQWGENPPSGETVSKFREYFEKQVEMIKSKSGVIR